jgi:hypothetical protein
VSQPCRNGVTATKSGCVFAIAHMRAKVRSSLEASAAFSAHGTKLAPCESASVSSQVVRDSTSDRGGGGSCDQEGGEEVVSMWTYGHMDNLQPKGTRMPWSAHLPVDLGQRW